MAAPSSHLLCLTKVHPCTIWVVDDAAAAFATLVAGRPFAGSTQAVCLAAPFLLDGLSPLQWAAFGSLQHMAVARFPRSPERAPALFTGMALAPAVTTCRPLAIRFDQVALADERVIARAIPLVICAPRLILSSPVVCLASALKTAPPRFVRCVAVLFSGGANGSRCGMRCVIAQSAAAANAIGCQRTS